jgi:hypothetical protein
VRDWSLGAVCRELYWDRLCLLSPEPPRVEKSVDDPAAVRRFAPVAPPFHLTIRGAHRGDTIHMPRKAFGLVAVKVLTARPGEYADGNGLRLVVRPTDARFWTLAFAISVLGCCFAARAEEAPVQSGNYAELIVGYEPKRNIVSGYFHSETGNGQFNCMFYLKGKFENNLAKVDSYFPGIENVKF